MPGDVLDLLHTAPEPPMSVDPYAAIGTARRARARRRIVVTALAAVVLAVAVGVVTVRDRDDDRTLPATPTPSPSPTFVQPVSDVILAVNAADGETADYEEVRVRFDPRTRVADVELRSRAGGDPRTVRVKMARGVDAVAVVDGRGTDHPVLVTMAPIDATVGTTYTTVWPGTARDEGRWTAAGEMPGVMLEVVVVGLRPGQDTSDYVGVRLGGSGPEFSDGSAVHLASLEVDGAPAIAWVNPTHALYAVHEMIPVRLPGDAATRGVVRGGGGWSDPAEGTWGYTLTGLLPAGARSVTLAGPAEGGVDVVSAAPFDAWPGVAVVLTRTMPGTMPGDDPETWPGRPTAVSWLDATGTRRTTPVSAPG